MVTPVDNASGYILSISNTTILPPIREYDAYVESQITPKQRTKMTGSKLRTAVYMSRNGETTGEIGRTIGMNTDSVRGWIKDLPEALR